jgi:hypothetical protein
LSTICDSFTIRNHDTGQDNTIHLVEDPDDEVFAFVERHWSPVLADQSARALLSVEGMPVEKRDLTTFHSLLGKLGAQDAHWNWRAKHERMTEGVQRMYALLDGSSVEGLMLINMSRYSQLPGSTSREIIYIEEVAVAPWNRAVIGIRRYEGLGRLMLAVAVSLSFDEEMEGRCGLHSLPQAEGFYQKIGMTYVGLVDHQGLKYFEFEPAAAQKYLKVQK